MIIVEGPDASGKDTLIEQLVRDTGLRLFVPVGNRIELWKSTRARTYQALQAALDHTIWIHNRLFFSELVYGPVLRHEVAFSQKEQTSIRGVLSALHIPVIACMPPVEVVTENIEHGEHLAHVRENIRDIYSGYVAVFERPGGWLMKYDYTGERSGDGQYVINYDHLLQCVDDYLRRRRARTW